MASTSGISKIISGLGERLGSIEKSLGKSSKGVAKSTGKAGRVASNLRSGLIGGALGSLIGGRNEDKEAPSSNDSPQSQELLPVQTISLSDPIINVPAIVHKFAENLQIEGQLIQNTQNITVDFETTKQFSAFGLIDPTTVVENYFDDNLRPIPIESIVPQGVKMEGVSNAINALAYTVKDILQRLSNNDAHIRGLKQSIDEAIDQNAATLRANERRRDEADVEDKFVPGGVARTAGKIGGVVGAYSSTYLIPAIALAAAEVSTDIADDNALNEETIGSSLSFLDDIEEKYVQLAAGFQAFKQSGTLEKMKTSAVEGGKRVAAGAAAARDRIKNADNVIQGQQLIKDAITKSKNKAAEIAEKIKANPAGQKAVVALRTLVSWMKAFANGASDILDPIRRLLAPVLKFAGNIFKGLLTKPIRWYIAIEMLLLLIPAADAFALGTMTEEDFGKRAKATINDLIDLIGGTYIGTMIGIFAGGLIGTFTLPVIGTVGGAVICGIAGFMLGDTLFRILPIDVVVNATYDYWFLDKKDAFNNLGSKLADHVVRELHKVADSAMDLLYDSSELVSGQSLEAATDEKIFKKYVVLGNDRVLNEEGMFDPVRLMREATRYIGTDLNAVSYAVKDIKTPEEYAQFENRFEEMYDLNLNDVLESELNDRELQRFKSQLESQYAAAMSSKNVATANNAINKLNLARTTARRNDEEAEVAKVISGLINDSDQKGLYELAPSIGENQDIDYENIKSFYNITNPDKDFDSALRSAVDTEEDAIAIEELMKGIIPSVETKAMQIYNQEIPDIESTTASSSQPIIIPITPVQNMRRPSYFSDGVLSIPAGTGRSERETFSPSYLTRDPFIDSALTT